MKFHYLIYFIVLVCSGRAMAQFERPDTWISVGYQYADFGNSLAPANIRMYGFNRENGDGKDFTNNGDAYGAVVRLMVKGNRGLTSEFAIGNKKVLNHGSYFDSTNNTSIDVSTKSRLRTLNLGLHYSFSRFTVGASLDLGFFTSHIRYKNLPSEGSDKWNPWFYTQKVLGSGETGKTPVVGWTASAGCALTKFLDLRVYKQFTAFGMGAELSNRYFSLSNWGVELAFTFGS